MMYLCFYLCIVVVVGFLQQFVNVSEGDGEVTLQVGVISGTLQRSISLEFQLVDGSAMGMCCVQ